MGDRIKDFFRKHLPWLYANLYGARKLLRGKNSYLKNVGWVRSFLEAAPVSSDGEPVPWMNYSAVALLDERLSKDLVLFEYGSGYSTRFFAKRVQRVISVEYDPVWYEHVAANASENLTLLQRDKDVDGSYCRAASEFAEDFDVIVVDGRDRANCVRQAVDKLTERGVILLDDSDRERFAPAFDFVRSQGFRVLSIRGIKPMSGRGHQASFIYRDNNCLGL